MNVLMALGIVVLAAAIGGIGHGFLAYGGAVMPKFEPHTVKIGSIGSQKNVVVTMWIPGILGAALFGAITGLAIFCIYTAPTVFVNLGGTIDLTFYNIGTALIAGLGGTVAVNELIEKKQWAKLAPALQQSDPAKQTIIASGQRPIEALRMLSK
jgi:hypothetical protein